MVIINKEDLQKVENRLDEICSLLKEHLKPLTQGWMKSAEAKRVLKCSDATLKNYRDKGLVPWKQVGSTYYYKIPKLFEDES